MDTITDQREAKLHELTGEILKLVHDRKLDVDKVYGVMQIIMRDRDFGLTLLKPYEEASDPMRLRKPR